MVFNTTFNNISVKLWWSVLLVEETRIPGENHSPAGLIKIGKILKELNREITTHFLLWTFLVITTNTNVIINGWHKQRKLKNSHLVHSVHPFLGKHSNLFVEILNKLTLEKH